jgi:hypothetical protein
MKYFIILILGSLVLFSCGKKQMIKVSAVNPVTGEGYAYLPFKIVQIKSGAFESKYKTVYEGELGADGKDGFDFRVKSGRQYRIATDNINSNDELPCYINNTSYTFTKNDTEFDFQFEYAPCAYLKLKIENVNCEGPGDEMVLYQGNQIGTFDFNQPWEHNGCAIWESNGYSDVPMGEQYYRWEVTRSGTTEVFHDTIYLEKHEQKVYEILY